MPRYLSPQARWTRVAQERHGCPLRLPVVPLHRTLGRGRVGIGGAGRGHTRLTTAATTTLTRAHSHTQSHTHHRRRCFLWMASHGCHGPREGLRWGGRRATGTARRGAQCG
eukprot:scaffold72858_cov55-Phaeocystis_antarctica.AAC.3